VTEKVASTVASSEWKKNCTPRLACVSVRLWGSVGWSDESPVAVEVNVRFGRSTATVVLIALPDAARSGVLKYAYSGTVSDST
jgi:hypothetical protein